MVDLKVLGTMISRTDGTPKFMLLQVMQVNGIIVITTVVAINFHGSTGYGDAFTRSILKNWGGAPFHDLMTGLDFTLSKYSFIDEHRVCALGASYGGYMVNWLNGHTERFSCIVNHDGIFDTFADYYSTDELWFPEYEVKHSYYSS
jgi:dipeptidyl aminopeptidase/acylaminoacyl peptidase